MKKNGGEEERRRKEEREAEEVFRETMYDLSLAAELIENSVGRFVKMERELGPKSVKVTMAEIGNSGKSSVYEIMTRIENNSEKVKKIFIEHKVPEKTTMAIRRKKGPL